MKKIFYFASKITNHVGLQIKIRLGTITELIIIILFAWIYAGCLLDFNPTILQQGGEHNESATRPLLADYGLRKHGEIPLWNHFMQTGFPHAGDLLGHFWSPIATIPVIIWGGINGMKVSIFISFLFAGIGQWYFGNVMGLKGMFRTWSAMMLMFSGGLALLWRLGWYELLVGMSWFPWAFASFWQTLHKQDVSSMIWAAFCASMILFAGGGYYPFYLAGGSLIIFLGAVFSNWQISSKIIQRAIIITIMIAGITAVMTLPIIDGYRLIARDVGIDFEQTGSQPLHYGLMNFAISAPEWFHSSILGTQGGWNWFYLGPLSIGALFFLVFAFRYQKNRPALITTISLFMFYMLWNANQFSIFKYIYQLFPFLYQMRFPNRLFIVASIPLLVLGGYCLQSTVGMLRQWLAKYHLTLILPGRTRVVAASLRKLANLAMLIILFLSAKDVFETNRGFAFAPESLDTVSYDTLRWLKEYDPNPYYISLGDGAIWWPWLPAAYEMELPVINFIYSQILASKLQQDNSSALFSAEPKYIISFSDQPPRDSILIKEFDYAAVWEQQNVLPFAFSVETTSLNANELDTSIVSELEAFFDGPNSIVVEAESNSNKNTLIVLVSNYPGWKLLIDQKPAVPESVNNYLSTQMLEGKHKYTFIFKPALHFIGLTITLLTIYILTIITFNEAREYLKQEFIKFK